MVIQKKTAVETIIENLIDYRYSLFPCFLVFPLVNGLHSKSSEHIRLKCLDEHIPFHHDSSKNELISMYVCAMKHKIIRYLDKIKILPIELCMLIFEYMYDHYAYAQRRLIIKIMKETMLNIISSGPYLRHYFYHKQNIHGYQKNYENTIRTYTIDKVYGVYDCIIKTCTNHENFVQDIYNDNATVTIKSQTIILNCICNYPPISRCQCLEHIVGISSIINSTKHYLLKMNYEANYEYILVYCILLGYISMDEFSLLLHLRHKNFVMFIQKYTDLFEFIMNEIPKLWKNSKDINGVVYCS